MAQNRSLAQTCHKILRHSQIVISTLRDLLSKGDSLNVLEVGFGQGRAIMELAWMFRSENVNFYGINKMETSEAREREDLRETARRYQIMPEDAIAGFRLPEVFFYDAAKLHFADESIDLVYSAVSIRFIERKAEFLEEVCRVLKPGGIALLHIGESGWNYPHCQRLDTDLLTEHLNRFILKYKDELIPLPAYLKLFENGVFDFQFINSDKCVLEITKLASGTLNLHLKPDEKLSMSLRELQERHGLENPRGGFRCVYDIPENLYRQLFEKGLLTKDMSAIGV